MNTAVRNVQWNTQCSV